jgi:glycosyltransferase involved in cell wall biosynthesis
MRETDVLIVASRDEALPLVVQEAMSLGKGIIATACGGVSECVTHETDGLVVPVGDRGALAAAIRRFLEDRGLARRLGEVARRTFLERYGVGVMAGRFEDVIRRHAKEAGPA